MKKCLSFLCLTLLIQGCASLTKSQIESVNQFAKTTQNFSAFPSHILSELAEIRLARSLYYANSLSDAKLHIEELDSSYEQNIFDKTMSNKVDITFKIIDKYAQSLLLLSSDKFGDDLVDQAKTFGIGIDSLVTLNNAIVGNEKLPTGIGAAVSQLVVIGGKQYIRIKQAKEIKKFVSIADTLVNSMCSHLLTFLKSSTIDDFIKGEERELYRDYKSYLQQDTNHTVADDKEYLAIKNKISLVKKLQSQSIEATADLKTAHNRLAVEIRSKRTLKQTIDELQILFQEVKSLKSTLSDIKSN